MNNQGTCPFCRSKITLNELTVMENNLKNIKKKEEENELKSKNDNLIRIIQNNKEGKFMIFSNYLETFYNIQNHLKKNKIKFGILSGTDKNIKKIINNFEKGKINVLMSNVNNEGLDLHMISDIIIYHKVKEEIEENVISRAHRLGRKTPLNVHYLYYENEFENDLVI